VDDCCGCVIRVVLRLGERVGTLGVDRCGDVILVELRL
jgi:hypothetical protein